MTDYGSPGARFLRNATPLLVAQLVVNAMLLLTTILIARILGVENFGLLAIGVALYGLTAFLSDAGLGMWGIRVIADHPDHWATVGRLTIARAFTVGLAFAVAVSAVSLLPIPEAARAPSFVMVLTVLPAGFSVEWALIGLERNRYAAVTRVMVAATIVVLGPPFALNGGPTGAAVAYVVAAGLGCVASWTLLIRTIGRPHRASPRGVTQTLRSSLPMGINAVLTQVYWQSDALFTGVLLGPAAAGLYAAPMRLLAAAVGIGWTIGTSLLPIYRALESAGSAAVSQFATMATRLAILACLPAIGLAIGGSTTIVTTILGAQFAGSAPVLTIGAITIGVWTCMVPTVYAILAMRRDSRYLVATFSAAFSAIPLILILGPIWGIRGVAVAMLAAQLGAALVIMAGAANTGIRLAPNPLARAFSGGLLIAATAAVAAAWVPYGIFGVIGVGVIAEVPFGVVALRMRSSPRSDPLSGTAHFP